MMIDTTNSLNWVECLLLGDQISQLNHTVLNYFPKEELGIHYTISLIQTYLCVCVCGKARYSKIYKVLISNMLTGDLGQSILTICTVCSEQLGPCTLHK